MKLSERQKMRLSHYATHTILISGIVVDRFFVSWIDWGFFVWSILWWYIAAVVGISVGFHKYFSHQSFRTNDFWETVFLFFGMTLNPGSPLLWCAVHRYHHETSDTEKDPTSPWFRGFVRIYTHHWNTGYIPKKAFLPMMRNRKLVITHEYYWRFQMLYHLLLFLVGGVQAWFWFGVVQAVYGFHGMGMISVLGHSLGYRNHDTNDMSVNNVLLNIIVPGEGWHNNHHYYPNRYNTGEKWWEFDPAGWIVKLVKE